MDAFALAPFAECVGDEFRVVGMDDLAWTLVEASGHGPVVDPATHHAFSLILRGPLEPALAQQTVMFAHPRLGELAIFVTPVAVDADGVRYEAVFN